MKYTRTYQIGFHQTDLNFKLKPYEFMNMAQDIATAHVQAKGCGQLDLRKDDMAWMLVKMNTEFVQMPCNMQDVVMQTWHKGQMGPVFYRDYTICDTNGNLLIKSTSIWATVNYKTRTLARPKPIMTDCIVNEDAMVDRNIKLRFPNDLPLVKECIHHVTYSDIDCNSHVNNTSYVIWALNALPYDIVAKCGVKSIEISYLNETKPETDVTIQIHSALEKEYFIKMTDHEGKVLTLLKIVVMH
ncbi:MAG: thioesterase [Paludibacteraceae bacterium]|nr:thioesterase [Paludibacteraceae bacterium]